MSDTPRCYTVPQLLERLQLTKRTFRRLRAAGKMPFLEEIEPRLGRSVRYRADLVDRYIAGHWGQSRFFRRHA